MYCIPAVRVSAFEHASSDATGSYGALTEVMRDVTMKYRR
jgi:hypothetical protein